MYRKKINLIGKRFGRLLVLEEVGSRVDGGKIKRKRIVWKCICDCGMEKVINGDSLRSGKTKSCGCLQKERVSEIKKVNLVEQRFGRLLVLEEAGRNKQGRIIWKCRCDCGTIKIASGDHLRSGNTKSCGCLQKEKINRGVNHYKYNLDLTDEERQIKRKYPEYDEWRIVVFERDSYTCQCCGDNKGGNLCAHHLESYADNPELRLILDNGVTLCEKCHKNFHRIFGYGNTEEQFEKFLLFMKENI